MGKTNNPAVVTQEKHMIDKIIQAYHTTRLSEVGAIEHILSKPYVQHALQRVRQQAIAQHEGGRGEPVALLQEHPSGDRELELYRSGSGCLTDADKAAGWTETSLYAHPPATRPAALAEDEVVTALRDAAKDRAEMERLIPGAYPRPPRQHIEWKAADRITQQAEEVARLREAARKAHDALIELNPSNYSHDDVCEANDATVEAILFLADALGETHGYTPEWWAARRSALNEQPGGDG